MPYKILKFILLISTTLTAHYTYAYQLEDLMASPEFAKDQQLATGILTSLNEFAPRADYIASGGHRKPHELHHKETFGQFWQATLKDQCSRLNKTYGQAMKESDFNDSAFLQIYNRFRNQFDDLALGKCDQFGKSIKKYIKEVGSDRALPFMINKYQKSLEELNAGSVHSGIKAFADQSTQRYTQRLNNRSTIQIHLAWLKAYNPKHPQLKAWEQQFNQLNDGFAASANDMVNQLLPKSLLPLDYYADDQPAEIKTGNALRQYISDLMNQQFGQAAQTIILRDSGLKPARRFIVADGSVALQNYQAMPFVAVIDAGNGLVSTHRGWYEKIQGNEPRLVILPTESNFNAPRIDQTVTTQIPKNALELRQQRDAERNSKNNSVTNQTQMTKPRDHPKDRQTKLSIQQPEIKTKGYFSFFLGLMTALLLIMAGMIHAHSTLSRQLPKGVSRSIDQVNTMITPHMFLKGLALLGFGVFSLVQSAFHFLLINTIVSLLAVASGWLLCACAPLPAKASSGILTTIQTKLILGFEKVSLLQNHKTITGIASIIIGLLMILNMF